MAERSTGMELPQQSQADSLDAFADERDRAAEARDVAATERDDNARELQRDLDTYYRDRFHTERALEAATEDRAAAFEDRVEARVDRAHAREGRGRAASARSALELTVARAEHAEETTAHLETGMETQRVIGQAQGLLMAHYKIDAEMALEMLAGIAQARNAKVREVARQVVAAEPKAP